MSDFKTLILNEDELTSTSSDERMDTGSESVISQDTPNSVLSDYEDREHLEPVLRLQNPELSHLNNSIITKMSQLSLDSPKLETQPTYSSISPPKFSSTLMLTTNHPLMSPDENYPDVVPKKVHKTDDQKNLSLSSIEDERHPNSCFYTPQRNTSKSNLYITESYITAEGLDLELTVPPDVARIDTVEKRKIVPKIWDCTPPKSDGMLKYIDGRKLMQSTPITQPVDISAIEEYHTGVAEWCESPSLLRSMPNFELPIEMTSSVGVSNDLESPDVISSSTQEDRSAYQALLDPYTGNVALRHTPALNRSTPGQRRKIQLPPEEDRCSLDSVSACSMESEDEPPELADQELEAPQLPVNRHLQDFSDDEESKMSKSTNTLSECSEAIPEYSAADELSNERAWVSVPRPDGRHAICDMKVIEPYKRVMSHGGYDARGSALIVFSACHLPDTARADYTYVMDNLFLYVIWTLERLVTDDYILVYLHGSAGRRRLPTFHWLHECYKLIDRRLRKSLKHLYLVHPTFWLKSFVIITKPFISSKFFRKLSYVGSLAELMEKIPLEPNAIPDLVKQYDATRR